MKSQPKCHETKSKHIDWILSIKSNHWVWPWPWIFKVKFWNRHISGIEGSIHIEQKGVIHDHDRDLLVTKMRCKDLPDSDRGHFRCRHAVDSSGLTNELTGWFTIHIIIIIFYCFTVFSVLLCSIFLAATKQLYEWYFLSVCLSVRLSVTPFSLCSHHRIIMRFSGVITNDQREVHAKGQGHRSRSQR